ncbi:unnamed protein product [Phytophthora lilii]|uniref:Unnamed protein product n=1 Tax=Phytophthora lilii TaxID=2077276 RepID=A0A9W7CQS7_9STRA|nr:unnamed protein product [Phytophthora lilii]
MDFLNKAKQAAEKYSGGSSSSSNSNKKSDSIFSKAMGAAEKYHAKEKVAEFAQKRVAKREVEKHQAGYVEKKDKSTVDKAVEAAEDFLAKQSQPKPQHSGAKKDNQMEDILGKAKEAAAKGVLLSRGSQDWIHFRFCHLTLTASSSSSQSTMASILDKAKEAAEKYTGGSHEKKDESKLHHLKHKAEKMAMKHAAKNYAEDHGFSKKKHHDNQDESLLDKAKEAVGKVTGHGDSHKKDNQDESVLDKAKEMVGKYTGHGDSHSHKKDKDDDSILDKAKEAVEKYTKKH